MRSMFVSSVLSMAVPALACVDPQQDYNDYTNRTADAHVPPAIVFDSGGETGPLYAPDAGFSSNLYFMSCLTAQAEGDVSKASLSVAKIAFTPNSSGGGGTITFGDQPLKINPTSLSDLAGIYYQAGNGTVAADGTATVAWGDTTIPGDGNPVTMMDLEFSSSKLDLHVESETQICGNLTGNLIKPFTTVVTGPCVFRVLPSASSPIPTLQVSDFHCP